MKTRKVIWKRVGLLLTGLGLLCGLIWLTYYVFRAPLRTALTAWVWKTDPVQAAQTARTLIDFDLPPGYEPEKVLALREGAAEAVIIVSRDHPTDLIYIGRTPDGILANQEWRSRYEMRGAHTIADRLYDTETVGTATAAVRGQPTALRFLKGADQKGLVVKQLACMFNGKNGEILLVMVASQATWDQAMVDDFLASIR